MVKSVESSPSPHVCASSAPSTVRTHCAHLGRAIAITRIALGIPAHRLASAAGVSPYALSRVERAHREAQPTEVVRLFSALGMLASLYVADTSVHPCQASTSDGFDESGLNASLDRVG